jgi:hypothetical protein
MVQTTRPPAAEMGAAWSAQIPDAQWSIYRRVLDEMRSAGLPVAFGGAFALATYTGDLRNTKDFDLYVLPGDRDAAIAAMSRAGLNDYFDRAAYDRSWIYRGTQDDTIVDAIWAMANLRTLVDRDWLSLGPEVELRDRRVRAIPPEELIWSKLYVLQRERSDWPDVLNLLDALGSRLDWPRLLERVGRDRPLVAGVLSVFGWLAPARAAEIPAWVWDETGARRGEPLRNAALAQARADLLDSRPWFRGAIRE